MAHLLALDLLELPPIEGRPSYGDSWFRGGPGGAPSRRARAEAGQLLPEHFTPEEKAALARGAVKTKKSALKHALRPGEVGGLTQPAAGVKSHIRAKVGPFSDINQLALFIYEAYVHHSVTVRLEVGSQGRAAE